MRVLITGLGGTVAPVLARHLAHRGHDVVGWDRAAVDPNHLDAVRDHLDHVQPDAVCHLAMGAPDWAAAMATWCAAAERRFLYTSTVSVFGDAQRGPFAPDALPEPADDYGRYKRACEQAIQAAHRHAHLVRIGWQIGEGPGGNQMVDYLDRTHRADGRLAASVYWYPACSLLDDTAAALVALLTDQPGGLYHLDSNPGWSMFEIVARLNRRRAAGWTVVPAFTPVRDHRLTDGRFPVASLAERL